MALRHTQPLAFQAFGVCDAIDGTNAQPGSMLALQNLVPNPSTQGTFVPRPAAQQLVSFAAQGSSITTEAGDQITTESGLPLTVGPTASNYGTVTALVVIGSRAYGMAHSLAYVGKDAPFCFDLVAGALIPLAGVIAANLPVSQSSSGDWTPPQMEMIAGKIIIAHPGYGGGGQALGFIDLRNFVSSSLTGTTHSSTLIDALSSNPIAAGVQVGDKVGGAGVPAGALVVSLTVTSITISLAATASGAGVALTFTSGTTAAPLYGAGVPNGPVPFVSAPIALQQFNGRAYYAVGNALIFTDSLNAMQVTNATQVLILGDTTSITALGGLPLGNQVVGGVVQSVIAFKGAEPYYQITGDASLATGNAGALNVNAVAGSVGTIAPNSITATPLGLAYIAPDGLRIVGLDGKSSEPIGADGAGVNVPFIYAVAPTRINAAYNQNVLRISVQNGSVNGQPYQEWWFHLTRKIWTGPHSFPATMIVPYQNGATNTFVMAAVGIDSILWQSDAVPSGNSTYVENGVALSWTWQTTLLPDNQSVSMNNVVQSGQAYALPAGAVLTVLASDESGAALGTVLISGLRGGATLWGVSAWGFFPWGGSIQSFRELRHKWPAPLTFKQMTVKVVGSSLGGFVIGNLYAKYQTLGYEWAA